MRLGCNPQHPQQTPPVQTFSKEQQEEELKLFQEVISYLKCLGPGKFQILLIYLLGIWIF